MLRKLGVDQKMINHDLIRIGRIIDCKQAFRDRSYSCKHPIRHNNDTSINLDDDTDVRLSLNKKENVKAASIGLGAIASFIGLYIGMIFLISGAAILALKELSESTDNVERYKMLRKLGVDRCTGDQEDHSDI